MDKFFDSLDISSNIEKGLKAVNGMRGIPAGVMATCFTLMNYWAIWPLVWYFDYDATRSYVTDGVAVIAPSLPGVYVVSVGSVVMALSLFPTFCEMFASRLARFGFTLAGWLVYASAAFDLVTDWPRVRAFTAAHEAAFSGWGWLATPLFWLYRAGMLVMGSFGFEAWLAVTVVLTGALLLQMFIKSKPARSGAEFI